MGKEKLIPKHQSGKTIQQALKTTTPREKRKETISSDNRSWLKKTTDNISGFVKNNKTHPAVVYPAIAAGTAVLMNPSSLVDLGLGIVAGKAFNERMKEKTGKSWGLYVGEKLDINPEVSGFFNPLYLAGNPIKKEITNLASSYVKSIIKNIPNRISNYNKSKVFSSKLNEVIQQGFTPRFGDQNTLFRTTTPKEVAALESGNFQIHPKSSNHNAYGWRKGAPFYEPGSFVENKTLSTRNNVNVDNPVYLTTPATKDLQVRIGSGGKYGDLVPSSLVHASSMRSYLPSGALYFPEESSVAFLLGDALPKDITAWQNLNGKWQFLNISYPKVILYTPPNNVQSGKTSLKFFEMVGNPTSVTRVVGNDGKIYLQLGNHSKGNPRQLRIEPQGNNLFRVHASTWGGITDAQKKQLYEALYNEIPEGGTILFPESRPDYLATRGTIAGLRRLERDPRYTPIGTILKLLYRDDKDGIVKTFEGTGFKKQQKASNSK